MNETQTSFPATLVSPDAPTASRRQAPAVVHMCLVVSTSTHRAQQWMRAAQDERWATIVCHSATEAMVQSVRQRVELALIDLQSAPPAQERTLQALVEQLTARKVPLVAVCGRPNDITGEVWSRQLGVWMYLPGVDSESDVALLCGEAREILKKLEGDTVHAAR